MEAYAARTYRSITRAELDVRMSATAVFDLVERQLRSISGQGLLVYLRDEA